MKKDYNNFYILKTIESDASVSQRELSAQMRLNVASVNFALKNLILRGFVTKTGENQRRTTYYITREGLYEKTHLAYKFYRQNIPFYKEVRNDIRIRILKAVNDTETDIAIYGTSELSEITYMVVSKIGLNFTGFFLDDSMFTNGKIFGYDVQDLKKLKTGKKSLLLVTEKLSSRAMDILETKNVDIINLID